MASKPTKLHSFEPSQAPTDQAAPIALGQALQQLQEWQRENLPGIDTPQGMSLLLWLARHDGTPQPMGSLYRECLSSEPVVRAVTKLFVENGLATLTVDGRDIRRRMLCATPKLRQAIEEYRRQFARVSAAVK